MIIKKKTNKFVIAFLLVLLLVPTIALAFGRTGVSPLDRGIEIISTVFNIQVLKTNPIVQEGFMKLMIFITLFSITHKALKAAGDKIFDNKTAGIVSFAFTMIGVFMMPANWFKATGGVITAIMSSLIFMFIFWGGGYYAMSADMFNPKKEGGAPGWVKGLLGVLFILLLLFILDEWGIAAQVQLGSADMVQKIYYTMVSWTYLLLTILLIAKIIGLFTGIGGGASGSGSGSGSGLGGNSGGGSGGNSRSQPSHTPSPGGSNRLGPVEGFTVE